MATMRRKAVSDQRCPAEKRVGFIVWSHDDNDGFSYSWQLVPIGLGWKARGMRRPRVAFFSRGPEASRRLRERMAELDLEEVSVSQ